MTVRVQNGGNLAFGTFAANTTVTHARLKSGSVTLTTKALTASVSVLANREFELPEGMIDLVFPEGELTDAGMKDIIDDYFDGTRSIEVELLTNATTEVTTSGYSSQSSSDWDVSTE